MKITNQSSNELVLTEGSTSGLIVGGVFVLAGILAGIFLRQATSYAIWIALALGVVGVLIVLFASSVTVSANKKIGQEQFLGVPFQEIMPPNMGLGMNIQF